MIKFQKKKIAVLFGGRSSEHEISIITALQFLEAIDMVKYDVLPVYIALNGQWYTGDALFDRTIYRRLEKNLSSLQQVTLLPVPTIKGLVPVSDQNGLRLDKVIPVDVFWLAFHGQQGEDGAIQGLLELANAAYTGSELTASAVGMDKYVCKKFLEAHHFPVLPSLIVKRSEAMRSLDTVLEMIENQFDCYSYPLFLKPCHLGSSLAVSKVTDRNQLMIALAKIFEVDDTALIEPCVIDPIELNISVMEGDSPILSPIEQPLPSADCLTFEDKYMRRTADKLGESAQHPDSASGMASLSRMIDPKNIPGYIKEEVKKYAARAFHLLGARGVVRFDFMFDSQVDKLYFNEVNLLPGSFAYYLWEKSNPPILYTEFIDVLIENAIRRKGEKNSLEKNVQFRILP